MNKVGAFRLIIRIPKAMKVVKRMERQERDTKDCQYLEALQVPTRLSLKREITRKSTMVL